MKLALLLHRPEMMDLMVSFEIDPAALDALMRNIRALNLAKGVLRLVGDADYALIPTSTEGLIADYIGPDLIDWMGEDSEGDEEEETEGLITAGLALYPLTGTLSLESFNKYDAGATFESEPFKLSDLPGVGRPALPPSDPAVSAAANLSRSALLDAARQGQELGSGDED